MMRRGPLLVLVLLVLLLVLLVLVLVLLVLLLLRASTALHASKPRFQNTAGRRATR